MSPRTGMIFSPNHLTTLKKNLINLQRSGTYLREVALLCGRIDPFISVEFIIYVSIKFKA